MKLTEIKENLKDIYQLNINESDTDKEKLMYLTYKIKVNKIKNINDAIKLMQTSHKCSKTKAIELIDEGVYNW